MRTMWKSACVWALDVDMSLRMVAFQYHVKVVSHLLVEGQCLCVQPQALWEPREDLRSWYEVGEINSCLLRQVSKDRIRHVGDDRIVCGSWKFCV